MLRKQASLRLVPAHSPKRWRNMTILTSRREYPLRDGNILYPTGFTGFRHLSDSYSHRFDKKSSEKEQHSRLPPYGDLPGFPHFPSLSARFHCYSLPEIVRTSFSPIFGRIRFKPSREEHPLSAQNGDKSVTFINFMTLRRAPRGGELSLILPKVELRTGHIYQLYSPKGGGINAPRYPLTLGFLPKNGERGAPLCASLSHQNGKKGAPLCASSSLYSLGETGAVCASFSLFLWRIGSSLRRVTTVLPWI